MAINSRQLAFTAFSNKDHGIYDLSCMWLTFSLIECCIISFMLCPWRLVMRTGRNCFKNSGQNILRNNKLMTSNQPRSRPLSQISFGSTYSHHQIVIATHQFFCIFILLGIIDLFLFYWSGLRSSLIWNKRVTYLLTYLLLRIYIYSIPLFLMTRFIWDTIFSFRYSPDD